MDFLKSTAGKVITGLVALAVIAAAVSWWQMDVQTREALLGGTGRVLAWLGVVLVAPWASFMLISRVARYQSNRASALFVGALTLVELVLLLWLFDWSIASGVAWTFVVVGVLSAGVYNLLACDWIAEKLD